MAERVAASFRCLSRIERQQVLRQVVKDLDFTEDSLLLSLLKAKNDIVIRFPLEVIIKIFDHLDICDTWRLQVVSKKWHAVLSGTCLLSAAIRRWNTHSASYGITPDASDASKMIASAASRIKAFRSGRPYTQLCLRMPSCEAYSSVQLKGQRLASQYDEHSILIYDLVRGVQITMHAECREKIAAYVLTSTTIAFISVRGLLYIRDLDQAADRTVSHRVPSAHVDDISGDNGTIVLCIWTLAPTRTIDMYIYDSSSQDLRSFHVEIPVVPCVIDSRRRREFVCHLILTERLRVIDVFYDLWLEGESGLGHIRLSTDGQLLTISRKELSGLDWEPFDVPPQPTGYAGLYSFPFMRLSHGSVHETEIFFDIDQNDFVEWPAGASGPAHAVVVSAEQPSQYDLAGPAGRRWKRQLFKFAYLDGDDKTQRVERETEPFLDQTRRLLKTRARAGLATGICEKGYVDDMVIDDAFCVTSEGCNCRKRCGTCIMVHCFDATLELPGFETTGFWKT